MTSKKLKIGPMPAQVEDYSHLQETEILWGRVVTAAAAILFAVVLLSWSAWQFFAPPQTGGADAVKPAMVMSSTEVRLPETSEELASQEPTRSGQVQAVEQTPVTEVLAVETAPAPQVEVEAHAAIISPVSIMHESIAGAELRSIMQDGAEPQALPYDVSMPDSGIMRVMLETRMEGIRGTVLYHDWMLGEKQMARVRIPVSQNEQASHSSKFINKQMLGDWTVKVLDERGELYAQANFRVQ